MQSSILSITTILLLVSQVFGLHFYLETGQQRCFYEGLIEGTLVVGKIDATFYDESKQLYLKNSNLRVEIIVEETFDNNHRVVEQKSASDGSFTFSSLDAGEHKFCLRPILEGGIVATKPHRIFFDVVMGSSHDYIDSKSTRKVDSLTAQVQNLNKQLETIHFEQEAIRLKEAEFRDVSESTNSRVIKWSIVQLIVLIGTCFYQLKHLKSFFVKQKIV